MFCPESGVVMIAYLINKRIYREITSIVRLVHVNSIKYFFSSQKSSLLVRWGCCIRVEPLDWSYAFLAVCKENLVSSKISLRGHLCTGCICKSTNRSTCTEATVRPRRWGHCLHLTCFSSRKPERQLVWCQAFEPGNWVAWVSSKWHFYLQPQTRMMNVLQN